MYNKIPFTSSSTTTTSSSSSPPVGSSPSAAELERSAVVVRHPALAPGRDDFSDLFVPGVVVEPMYIPADRNLNDMRLMWHYTASTYTSLSSWTGFEPRVARLLRVNLLEYAFHTPFLMDGLLGLTAMHMNYLERPDTPTRLASMYRARAMAGYRKAIEEADPKTFPALLVSSLVICGLSSAEFRGPDAKPLYVLDWMTVWRGIGLIIQLTKLPAVAESGLAVLFYRPEIDLDASATYVPSNLLFMVSSIPASDPDFPHMDTYYTALKFLGSLYRELTDNGFGPILDLRIIVFLSFTSLEFLELARAHRPRAAIIVAHYLVFLKLVGAVWWMSDIPDREIKNVADLVGPGPGGLSGFMRVPRAALKMTEAQELARLLLNNHEWQPPAEEKVEQPAWPVRSFVDNTGMPMKLPEVGRMEDGFIFKTEEDGR